MRRRVRNFQKLKSPFSEHFAFLIQTFIQSFDTGSATLQYDTDADAKRKSRKYFYNKPEYTYVHNIFVSLNF